VDSAAARVALHQDARSRGYKLSREGVDPRSLGGGVCNCLSETCVHRFCVCCVFDSSLPSIPVCVALASPFIVFKGGLGLHLW
jgi:hypothetical protein